MTADVGLSWADCAALFGHFALVSILAIGGAVTTAPEMHRYVVAERGWISDAQFTASIALAQAAPGPNLLFVVIIGWNIAGPIGAMATLFGILLPSSTLALIAARWARTRRETVGVRAFVAGMAPLTVALLFSSSIVLAEPLVRLSTHRAGMLALIACATTVLLTTRVAPIWLIALGAVAGAMGWV